MPTPVTLDIRKGRPPVVVDLDTLTPKARALAEAIHMSFKHQPLGVLCDTGRTKSDNPNHAYLYGSGPNADEIGARPDLRFMRNLEPQRRDTATSPEEWLEYNARQLPFDAWPIAGARSRIAPLDERVPSAEAAREDRCLTRTQVPAYLTDAGAPVTADGWSLLWKAGQVPEPRHHALDGRMPLWHADDLDAYASREFDRWPLSRVAQFLGYEGPSASGTARRQLSRWGLMAVDRAPGRGGEGRFAADQVEAVHQARPGRGRWADSRA